MCLVDFFARQICRKLRPIQAARTAFDNPQRFVRAYIYKSYGNEDFPSSLLRRSGEAKKIEFRTIARVVLARNNKQPSSSIFISPTAGKPAIREPRVFWQRDGILDDTKKRGEERAGIPFKINKVTPTNPRGFEIKRLGDVAEWRCRVLHPPL